MVASDDSCGITIDEATLGEIRGDDRKDDGRGKSVTIGEGKTAEEVSMTGGGGVFDTASWLSGDEGNNINI